MNVRADYLGGGYTGLYNTEQRLIEFSPNFTAIASGLGQQPLRDDQNDQGLNSPGLPRGSFYGTADINFPVILNYITIDPKPLEYDDTTISTDPLPPVLNDDNIPADANPLPAPPIHDTTPPADAPIQTTQVAVGVILNYHSQTPTHPTSDPVYAFAREFATQREVSGNFSDVSQENITYTILHGNPERLSQIQDLATNGNGEQRAAARNILTLYDRGQRNLTAPPPIGDTVLPPDPVPVEPQPVPPPATSVVINNLEQLRNLNLEYPEGSTGAALQIRQFIQSIFPRVIHYESQPEDLPGAAFSAAGYIPRNNQSDYRDLLNLRNDPNISLSPRDRDVINGLVALVERGEQNTVARLNQNINVLPTRDVNFLNAPDFQAFARDVLSAADPAARAFELTRPGQPYANVPAAIQDYFRPGITSAFPERDQALADLRGLINLGQAQTISSAPTVPPPVQPSVLNLQQVQVLNSEYQNVDINGDRQAIVRTLRALALRPAASEADLAQNAFSLTSTRLYGQLKDLTNSTDPAISTRDKDVAQQLIQLIDKGANQAISEVRNYVDQHLNEIPPDGTSHIREFIDLVLKSSDPAVTAYDLSRSGDYPYIAQSLAQEPIDGSRSREQARIFGLINTLIRYGGQRATH